MNGPFITAGPHGVAVRHGTPGESRVLIQTRRAAPGCCFIAATANSPWRTSFSQTSPRSCSEHHVVEHGGCQGPAPPHDFFQDVEKKGVTEMSAALRSLGLEKDGAGFSGAV
jgi:hypothetical protein